MTTNKDNKDISEKKSRKKTISQNDPELFSGRIPPQDLEAERSLLGAILLDDSAFPEVIEKIKPIDFYEKNGFVPFDKHIFVLGDDEQTDIMMKMEL